MTFKENLKNYPMHLLTPFLMEEPPAGIRRLSDEEKQWVIDEIESRTLEVLRGYSTSYLSSIDNEAVPKEFYANVLQVLSERGYFIDWQNEQKQVLSSVTKPYRMQDCDFIEGSAYGRMTQSTQDCENE